MNDVRPAELAQLGDELTWAGYGEFVACFNPLTPNPAAWRRCRRRLPDRLGAVVDLFLLGEAVSPDALPHGIRTLLPGLIAAELLIERPYGAISTPGLVILPVFGHWVICQPPRTNPVHYLGADSIALLPRLTPAGARSCLDLCAGPGLHALHSARFATRVTAVEQHPAAARLALLNSWLNRVEDRIEVLTGDLYEPVAGRRFDLISANPPMLPYPDQLAAPVLGHGGADGLRLTWRILEGLPDALTTHGRAHLVGMTVSDGATAEPLRRMRTLARDRGLDIRCSVLSHVSAAPGSPFFERLVTVVGLVAQREPSHVREAYRGLLADLDSNHLCTYFLQVRRGDGELEVIDVADPGADPQWYV